MNPLTINTFDNGVGNAITVGTVGPAAGLKDSFHLIVGDTFHSTVGAVGNVTLNGDEVVTLSSVGGAAAVGANTIGFVSVRPTIGGLVDMTIDGTNDLTVGVTGTGGIAALIYGWCAARQRLVDHHHRPRRRAAPLQRRRCFGAGLESPGWFG